ncbi:hypothetical protein DFJ74DRAFT_21157 [Hyaloraphidium curvatum]|nr:hypothetical protein DFJ74DRAFT_21157 [Hyaloraphidium curvatum]
MADDSDDEFLDAEDDVAVAVERLSLDRDVTADENPAGDNGRRPEFFDPARDTPQWRRKSETDLSASIQDCYKAIAFFMQSRMAAAEGVLTPRAGESLYHGLALAAIHTLRALITFEGDDVAVAKDSLRNALAMADALRRPPEARGGVLSSIASVAATVASTVANAVKPGSTLNVKQMTTLMRHAELIRAEVFLMRALLAIITDGNILSFVREGLNIRSSYGTYTTFYSYLDRVAKGKTDLADEVDDNFLAGVLFGIGTFNLLLSMLPSKIVKLFEVVGYGGDQDLGLACLEAAAGYKIRPRWSMKAVKEAGKVSGGAAVPPKCAAATFPFSPCSKALRQFLARLQLAMFHSVFPTLVPLVNADVEFGRTILEQGLKAHPNAIPFLEMHSRLFLSDAQPDRAAVGFTKLLTIQEDWPSLSHLAMWELVLAAGASLDYGKCAELLTTLLEESKWSPAVYLYGVGVCLYALGKTDEAAERFAKVNAARQKIAGKSIPLEKYLARKTRRFASQGKSLLLPELEFFYFFNIFDMMPGESLEKVVQTVDEALAKLQAQNPVDFASIMASAPAARASKSSSFSAPPSPKSTSAPQFPTASGFADDLCLCLLLRSVADIRSESPGSLSRMRQVTPSTVLARPKRPNPPVSRALDVLFGKIPAAGHLISLEHWIVPFARYVAAVCHEEHGDYAKAQEQLELASAGGYAPAEAKAKGWSVGPNTGRKFSMQQPLETRCWNLKRKLDLEAALQNAMV